MEKKIVEYATLCGQLKTKEPKAVICDAEEAEKMFGILNNYNLP